MRANWKTWPFLFDVINAYRYVKRVLTLLSKNMLH